MTTATLTTTTVADAPRRRATFRSTLSTPVLLRTMLGGTWGLAALFLLVSAIGLERHRHATQTIGRDAAPSIIAAQHIRTSLAWSHADAARVLRGEPDAPAAYDGHRRDAADQMVAAARNITYGDAEAVPIRGLVDGLGRYGAAVATARALTGAASRQAMADADHILHADLLVNADALDHANRDALERGYAGERSGARWATVATAVAGVALVAGLVGIQVFLARRTRRLMNPALVVATLVAVVSTAWLVAAMAASAEYLRATKADAFDSISALTQARSVAVDGYATRLAGAASTGATGADLLASPPPGMTMQGLVLAVEGGTVPDGFTGFLADELRNITFVGERDAATEALRTYVAYRAATTADAAARFAAFDAALGRVLDINQAAFDGSVAAGLAAVEGRWWWSAATAVVVSLGAYVGLRPRLREYAA